MTEGKKSKQAYWIILAGVCVLGLVAVGLGTDTFKMKKADTASVAAITAEQAPVTTDTAIKTVAVVNGQTITGTDMDEFLAMLPPQMKAAPMAEIYPMVQDQLVANAIVLQKAEVAISPNDAEVQKRMEEARAQIIRGLYLEQEVNKHITDADVQKAYADFMAKQETPEEVSARHILVPTEAEAKDIITKLQAGEEFKTLSAAHSQDPGTKATGDLGYFTRDMMVQEFADAAFGMNKGEISPAPVKTQFGYHVIQVMDKRTRPVPTLEQVKPSLEAELRRAAFGKILTDLRKDATVELFDMSGQKVEAQPQQPQPQPEMPLE